LKNISTLEELDRIIRSHKEHGERIVLANGCFDLIHVGHTRYLRESKRCGDILVVAINSDSSVGRLKGPGRPILPESERAAILSAFECVDYIIVFSEPNVEKILQTIKPDVHAKGSDYTRETVPERATVLSYGGEIAITGGPKVRSTSEILSYIRNNDTSESHG